MVNTTELFERAGNGNFQKGVKTFKRKVSGIFGHRTKTEGELALIISQIGMAGTHSQALEAVKVLENQTIPYKRAPEDCASQTCYGFQLQRDSESRYSFNKGLIMPDGSII